MSGPSGSDDHAPPKKPNFLEKQLERARFERALEVAESLVDKHAFLNTAELARLNNILRGHTDDPWREGAAECVLPSGRPHQFSLLADPVKQCREILKHAMERADQGEVEDAAADLYAQLVMTHVFKDANRRTAVVACSYLLRGHGYEVSAMGLHELGLGDLRVAGQLEALRETVRSVVRMGGGRGKP